MQKILSLMRKLIEEFNLIEKGDKIAVGLSGGKDSLLLLTALNEYKKYIMPDFEIVAISIDCSGGKMDYSNLKKYVENLNISFYLIKSDIFEIIFDIRKEKNPCSLCAKLRRGSLNDAAKSLGCNKVCLGHHADDLIETFILSLFFEGRLNTIIPKTYLSKTQITAIRPMLYVKENDIIKLSKSLNLPVVKNICPADKHTQRQTAKDILSILNEKYPNAKAKLMNALTNPQRNNLWDKINN